VAVVLHERPEDVDGFAAAVLRLAGEPELQGSLAAARRSRVERPFTLERQAEGIDAAYRAAPAGAGG
jgi:glycosyltransferase involved in cell wall biosynthesis